MTQPNDATELANQVRAGAVSPLELVDAAIARADRANPDINAIIHPRYEAARAEATSPVGDGPLAGVPMVVKDLGCAMAGEPHHMGMNGLKRVGYTSEEDSALYRRFRRLGLIAIGRTNTPELGLTITTEPQSYGPSRNPWNLDHSTGGSSGGSAATVAAGVVPVGHANDGGGSIRIPASECGLVGLKPTRARVSQAPFVGEGWAGFTADGVVTRSVRDTAAVLDGIAGPEPGDPYPAPGPSRPFLAEVGTDPGSLRIALAPTVDLGTVSEQCRLAVEQAGLLLESLGHHVTEAQPAAWAEPAFFDNFVTILMANTATDVAMLEQDANTTFGPEDIEPGTAASAEIGRLVTASQYIEALGWIHSWHRRLAGWWSDYDVLVCPTLAAPPPPIGWLSDPDAGADRLRELLLTTAQFNASGQPAVSLPLHWTPDGLPVGVQFVGPYGDEAMLIRLASQLEAAAPWAERLPPLWVG